MERNSRWVGILLIVACCTRVGVVVSFPDHLSEDRDAYLGLAHELATGNGYSTPGSNRPTAFRPPLYPLVLSQNLKMGGGSRSLAAIHVVLGVLTVLMTVQLGQRLGLHRGRYWAGLLVAVDPLLVQYTSFPMTETLFTFLVAGLLLMLVRTDVKSTGETTVTSQIFTGVVFGLCALCRPTIWAFGLLLVFWKIAVWLQDRFGKKTWEPMMPLGKPTISWPCLIALVLIVLPWGIRNNQQFGKFKFTTTHGGYTLLLGNNPVFYSEVVNQPWGTVWQGESLDRWQQQVDLAFEAANPDSRNELERDVWMYHRALKNISTDQTSFLRACGLRFLRFWNVFPLSPSLRGTSSAIVWGIGIFYSFIGCGLALGLVRMLKEHRWQQWIAFILLLIAFTAVHLLFWSNMRMRAPLVPVIAIISILGWSWFFGQNQIATHPAE